MVGTPVREALQSAQIALEASGVENPRLDAEVLLAHALGIDRARLITDRQIFVDGQPGRRFRDDIRLRTVQRVPVAYLVGRKAFRHIELEVDQRVLIPRPETEHLVEAALTLGEGAVVHEVGTGSGAVALALASERPDLVVSGSDVSPDAIEVARANAKRLGLPVDFVVADLLDGIGPVDAVIANLPYVEESAKLAPELSHEPAAALFAGADGLDAFRRFAAQVTAPWVALEVGAGQAAAVAEMLDGYSTRLEKDLAGIDRVVIGWR
ncbi:MAG TPA: peptide chain release factor N(5)-glutamine methyltransferase [Baekduia sp.]|nr:peptide chain release factor N(5)-glutamine methyltransferase [Baekduia sp.]